MAAAEMNLELNVGVIVRPGDTLIVCCGREATSEVAAVIRDRIMSRLPGLSDVVVLGAESVAAYRPAVSVSLPEDGKDTK